MNLMEKNYANKIYLFPTSYRELFLRMKHVKWKKDDRFVKGQSFSFLVYDGQKEIRWPSLFEIK